jgi:hypothetical protein
VAPEVPAEAAVADQAVQEDPAAAVVPVVVEAGLAATVDRVVEAGPAAAADKRPNHAFFSRLSVTLTRAAR